MNISVAHGAAPAPTAACEMSDRLSRVQHWCETTGETPQDITKLNYTQLQKLTERILVDDKHKVLFCDIPKAG